MRILKWLGNRIHRNLFLMLFLAFLPLNSFAQLTLETSGLVFSVAFSPDGNTLASGEGTEEYGMIRLWNVQTGEPLRSLEGHSGVVLAVAFSPDANTLASGSADTTIRLWDIQTGETQRTLEGHTDWVRSVAFSSDGGTLASGSDDSTIRLWDVQTGETRRTLEGHTDWVQSVAFSPDGGTLASGSDDATIRLWNVETGETQRTLVGHGSYVFSIAYSPDGSLIASGSLDDTVQLWNAQTGDPIRTLEGHSEDVNAVAFSPDSNTLASGGGDDDGLDNTVRFWNVETGEHLHTLDGHTNWVTSVAFSPDGNTLASASTDGTIRLWSGVKNPRLIGVDVNRDGVADILDLIQIGDNYGQTGTNDADVNGDGVVDIVDLVVVAGRIGDAAAAPYAIAQAVTMLNVADVQRWLTDARGLELSDLATPRGLRFLQHLLSLLTPPETALLPNYPNPFNPETWIPYQLTHDAEVSLSIYNANGAIVRMMNLGYQPAGFYTERNRAAHWDGRNDSGETVASGMYFYRLRAGDYSHMRRMVIVK